MTYSAQPILTAHLFSKLDAHLIELLESLSNDDWHQKTIVPQWTVKDITCHLLDTALRRLSFGRDQLRPDAPAFHSNEDLVTFINSMNREGVKFFNRLSAKVLISLMKVATTELSHYVQTLDPYDKAPIGVSWAGETESLNWFDIAREYTERWHHQQQIRDAVNRPGIMTRELYFPVLDSFMRSLPLAYRNASYPEGTSIRIKVSGDAGGSWNLRRTSHDWQLASQQSASFHAEITMPQEIAWRIFTKGISKAEAERIVEIHGDRDAAMIVLNALAIVG